MAKRGNILISIYEKLITRNRLQSCWDDSWVFCYLALSPLAPQQERHAIYTPADTKCVASEWKYFSYCGRINSVVRALAWRTGSISEAGPYSGS